MKDLPKDVEALALKAFNRVPHLFIAGIDIIHDGTRPYFLEANSKPIQAAHYNVQIGEPTDTLRIILEEVMK